MGHPQKICNHASINHASIPLPVRRYPHPHLHLAVPHPAIVISTGEPRAVGTVETIQTVQALQRCRRTPNGQGSGSLAKYGLSRAFAGVTGFCGLFVCSRPSILRAPYQNYYRDAQCQTGRRSSEELRHTSWLVPCVKSLRPGSSSSSNLGASPESSPEQNKVGAKTSQ
ncbi:hypothetical protein E4U59_001450 [Claviceps monticola]|nr:hypothetical protein E4U59_001450 [Claviceps monticola]